MSRCPRRKAKCSAVCAGSTRSRAPVTRVSMKLAIYHPPTGEPVLERGQNQNQKEQEERQRGAVAITVVLEELIEDVDAGGHGRVVRAAAGHDVDVVKRLEGSDHGKDEQEVGRGRDHREGDVAKKAPASRAVHLCRV